MNIRETILTGFAAASLLSINIMPVVAADVAPANKMFSPVRASSWTGFYAGVNAGYAFGDANSALVLPAASNPFSSKYDGFIGGAQMGYNWQAGSIVFGVEAEINYADVSGSRLVPSTTAVATNTLEWFGTARGRIGYAFDRVMPYVTGGFAFGKNKLEVRDAASAAGAIDFATHRGWALGGGVEVMVRENWSAKVEYLHVDLGNKNTYMVDTIGGAGSFMSSDLKFGLVRGGLNYRF